MYRVDTTEKDFETRIENHLLNVNQFQKRSSQDYDAELCLIPSDVIDFIQSTQPKQWAKLKKVYKDRAREHFLERLASEIDKRGTLDVLRKGVKDSGSKFRLIYFKPNSTINTDLQQSYEANLFSLVRQLYFSEKDRKSLDLAICLNGLPIFTAELKNHFSGQTVRNAIRQYQKDRDPKEPIFKFGRCLTHYAVDPDLVYMTSKLDKGKTYFLPFNQGRGNGAGNPPNVQGFATAYLWEQIWTKDSILNLIDQFIHRVKDEDGRELIIVPRYHQLDAVRRLVQDAKVRGSGQRYLIQHSAGSGKSFSIAWLAHQLAVLHDEHDERVFETIIVITDRRVLDRQLQETMRQFEQVRGTVENIDQTSRQLRQALEDGKQIIVTTLQKFPIVLDQIRDIDDSGDTFERASSRFAIIIDEAHSSQSGETTKHMKTVLDTDDLDDAETDDGGEQSDYEDMMVEEIRRRKIDQPNISMFAFTATPKQKTLELFGKQRGDGKFEAFSSYSMRQAIEEGFILDVLENYTTYKSYWRLLKTVEDDPDYESNKAKSLIRRFVDLSRHAIQQKINIIAEHFHSQVQHKIDGKAKAMIVTRSRLHAVRYFLALRRYLQDQGYPYQALVAFSGTVKDGAGDFTEAGLNGFPDTQTQSAFEQDEYKFLVVANKFQTGFDQPLLHTMYVDKTLHGVHAVQTLSRLNRTHRNKQDTFVLDFANEAEHIQRAFAPYYERTLLCEQTDPNLLYDRENELKSFDLFTDEEVNQFAWLYFNEQRQDLLHAPLDVIVERFEQLSQDLGADFRSKLIDYIRQYAFLSQILPFEDTDLEKLYIFARFLRRKLPIEPTELPREVLDNIDIESYRVRETSSGKITPEYGEPDLDPISTTSFGYNNDNPHESLSMIVQELNDRFGFNLSDTDKVTIEYVENQVAQSDVVKNSFKVNSKDKARMTFEHVAEDAVQDIYQSNFRLYQHIADNKAFRDALFSWLFERYIKMKGE